MARIARVEVFGADQIAMVHVKNKRAIDLCVTTHSLARN